VSLREREDIPMGLEITIVSGLPRSGTSLMMQMLQRGGMAIVTDGVRAADVSNPHGYLELEKVKRIKDDVSWLPYARGKALKMVSHLLYDLPGSERYHILFMERDLDEVLASQEKMLASLGRDARPREIMKRAYTLHLERLAEWLDRQAHIQVLRVNYRDLMADPAGEAGRVCEFLGGRLDVGKMAAAVDASLYRNRIPAMDDPQHPPGGDSQVGDCL
jgi:hypothetical protein